MAKTDSERIALLEYQVLALNSVLAMTLKALNNRQFVYKGELEKMIIDIKNTSPPETTHPAAFDHHLTFAVPAFESVLQFLLKNDLGEQPSPDETDESHLSDSQD